MKSLMLPASVKIGPANCPNPEQVLIPPNAAKASPNVKWHLLNGVFMRASPVSCVVQAGAPKKKKPAELLSLSPRLLVLCGL